MSLVFKDGVSALVVSVCCAACGGLSLEAPRIERQPAAVTAPICSSAVL